MKRIKHLIWQLISRWGRLIRDERTGKLLGRALVAKWGSSVWLIGLHRPYVRAVFMPQKTLHYARHSIGFATHPEVNYPRATSLPREESVPKKILWAMITHQSAADTDKTLGYWRKVGLPIENIFFAHGGTREDFEALPYSQKAFVEDLTMRTTRHPVEKQSYSAALREISEWMKGREYTHVCLVEYDHLPLTPSWGDHLLQRLAAETADVLFHHLSRVDGTNAPHYLYHLSDPRFRDVWKPDSRREDGEVVLNALATGSFWRRDAFDAVAAKRESIPIYLEMFLPTQAHHLGFRVRDHGSQNEFIDFDPLSPSRIRAATTEGAWSLHPVKDPSVL